jgi:membrane-associated phospholipid phosphatase
VRSRVEVTGVPFLVLVVVSLIAGLAAAYVVSRDPFRSLATEGPTGFSAVVAVKAAARRDGIKGWLAACRHRTTAAGLAFCAALAIFSLGWLCVGLLALLVRESPALLEVDSGVAGWAYVNASDLSLQATFAVTLLGDTLVVGGFALVFGTVDWLRRHDGRMLLFLAAIVVGDALITIAVKLLMDRARPTLNPIADMLGPSFPSGHASMAAAFYAAAALLLTQGRSRASTAAIGGAAVAIAVAVAASRVFLDVHWLSDVVAGLAFGWGWFAFCVLALGSSRAGSRGRRSVRGGRRD